MPADPLGFGAADWLVFAAGALLALAAFAWTPAWQRRFELFAQHTRAVMLLLFAAPIVLRLLLLPHHPVPSPGIYDEFSHLLVADTLLHARLANPPHPLHQFFETFFVLQRPTYGSIYPLGQGLLLAFGRLIAGTPWAGVLVAGGCLAACCFWMLRGFVAPGWALLGGVLAVAEFGPLNLWMNCYWGGLLPAAAGCLVFGSAVRLGEALARSAPGRRQDAVLLGAGLGAHLVTRPFESTFLLLCAALFLLPAPASKQRLLLLVRALAYAACLALPALALLLCQNKAVTGAWRLLPEALSQYQYGVPTTLTVQAPAAPHVALTPQQALEYRSQALMHGPDHDTWRRFLLRLEYRVRDYRFFFLPPLYLAALAFLFTLRRRLPLLVACSLLVFALGTNLFPYLLVHYLAGVTCLFILVSVWGLESIAHWRIHNVPAGAQIVRVLVVLCLGEFVAWYGLHLFETPGQPFPLLRYETWDAINHPGNGPHAVVARQLAKLPGKLLVFVHYGPHHVFQDEWVWNAADIDRARTVFARDLGAVENRKLIARYPDRKVLALDPDIRPATLTDYPGA